MKHKIHLVGYPLENGNVKVYLFQSGKVEMDMRFRSENLDLCIESVESPQLTNSIIFVNGDDEECNFLIKLKEYTESKFAALKSLAKEYNERRN